MTGDLVDVQRLFPSRPAPDGFVVSAPQGYCIHGVSRGLSDFFVFGALFLMFSCSGAVRNRSEVSGEVKFNGEPVQSGSIAIIPDQGTQGVAVGGAVEGGKYKIPADVGPMLGRHRVEIRSTRKTGRRIKADDGAYAGQMVDEIEMYIPEEYNVRSTLVVDITAGINQADFDLRNP